MSSSIHRVEVVEFKIKEKHPNADSLSLVDIFDGGYVYCARTEDWQGKTRAYYVAPDNLVPVARPEFSFLALEAKADGFARIKAKKLRGIVSYGLMIPAPDDAVIGTDVTEMLGVKEYDPEVAKQKQGNHRQAFDIGQNSPPPAGLVVPKYDVENLRRYHKEVFSEGEPVVIREKLDGQNTKFVYHDGQFFCGSRSNWKREYPEIDHLTVEYFTEKGKPPEEAAQLVEKIKKGSNKQDWTWQTKDFGNWSTPTKDGIDRFLVDHPSCVLFGESYGNVGGMSYGCKNGQLAFAAFDVLEKVQWWDADKFNDKMLFYGIPMAPIIQEDASVITIPYSLAKITQLCDGMSIVFPTQIKEGVVVTSLKERHVHNVGRSQLKCVSPTYSEKKK